MSLILGIETSCDETSASIVKDGKILSNVVSSQVDLHAVYGGVVPEVASRQHLKLIDSVIAQACEKASVHPKEVDAFAVTRGPGLPSALLVGVATAKGMASRWKKPLIPIHHMEAHLYSPTVAPEKFIALIVSGGHTMLVQVEKFGHHKLLGQTRDDAAGEAFDKAAQLLGLGYPGGPVIEREAKIGNPTAFDFPRPMIHSDDWNFSFSGLKTALRRTVSEIRTGTACRAPTENEIADLCASFQAAIIETLVTKSIRAAKYFSCSQIAISGGVACNGTLRAAFETECKKQNLQFVFAERALCTDNAGMIALLAERKFQAGLPSQTWDIEPDWVLT
jgi:N6-L-threonylcarbamoyladenine synthase